MTDTPHPSGLPRAPWRTNLSPSGLPAAYNRADEMIAITLSGRPIDDRVRIAAAIAIIPDLIVEAQRLIAADRAFEESAPQSAEERAALDAWDETSIDAVQKMEALLARAGITVPSFPEPPAGLAATTPGQRSRTLRSETAPPAPPHPPVWDGAGEHIGEPSHSLWPPMPRFRVDPIDPDEALLTLNPGGSA